MTAISRICAFWLELTRLKASQPEALSLASYIADGAILVREARALGFAIPLLGASTVNSPEQLMTEIAAKSTS
jgi:ABC-type branched-subunit amino acid transport system substrate-binding protein